MSPYCPPRSAITLHLFSLSNSRDLPWEFLWENTKIHSSKIEEKSSQEINTQVSLGILEGISFVFVWAVTVSDGLNQLASVYFFSSIFIDQVKYCIQAIWGNIQFEGGSIGLTIKGGSLQNKRTEYCPPSHTIISMYYHVNM